MTRWYTALLRRSFHVRCDDPRNETCKRMRSALLEAASSTVKTSWDDDEDLYSTRFDSTLLYSTIFYITLL